MLCKCSGKYIDIYFNLRITCLEASCLSTKWGDLNVYAFLLFPLLRQVLLRVAFNKSLCDPGSSTVTLESVACISSVLSGGRTPLAPCAVGSFSSTSRQEVLQGSGGAMTSHVEFVKLLGHKAGLLKEVVEAIANDLRRSTACPHQGKWSRFLHWCRGWKISPSKATVL